MSTVKILQYDRFEGSVIVRAGVFIDGRIDLRGTLTAERYRAETVILIV